MFPEEARLLREEPPPAKLPPRNMCSSTADTFASFMKQLSRKKRFAIDLETTGLDAVHADLVGMSFSWQEGEAWYLAFRAPEGEATLELEPMLAALRPILQDPAVAKINQNIKYDLLALRGQGIQVEGVSGDSMVADYLLHAGEQTIVLPICQSLPSPGHPDYRLDR